MRRRYFACLLALLLLTAGCSRPPEVGDFSFEMPQGYQITEVSARSCTIVNDGNMPVGGINLTDLRGKDIWKGSERLFRYVDDVARDCEFFSWHGGDRSHPLQYMSLYVTDPETRQKQEYHRIFFVKDTGVYDMWFDMAQIDRDSISVFHTIAENAK